MGQGGLFGGWSPAGQWGGEGARRARWSSQGIRSGPTARVALRPWRWYLPEGLRLTNPPSRPQGSSRAHVPTLHLLIKVLFLECHQKQGVGSNSTCLASPILIALSATRYDSDESGSGRGAPSLLGGNAPPCKQKINTALLKHKCQ